MSADKGGKTHEGVAAAKEDFKLYLTLSKELLKFITKEDIDEFPRSPSREASLSTA